MVGESLKVNALKHLHTAMKSLALLTATRSGKVGTILMLFNVFLAIFAPFLVPHDPFLSSYDILSPPSAVHRMGTDWLGRDVYSQVVYGSRVSLMFGILAAFIALVVGVLVGGVSGFIGGWVDDLLTRITDYLMIVPHLLVVILLVAFFGRNLSFVILVVGLTSWPENARLLRSEVISVKERLFVKSAFAAGGNNTYVLFRHVIPNAIQSMLANSFLTIASAVMLEAGLSFLGLGDPEVLSWGQLVNMAQQYYAIAWWLVVYPGIMIVMLVLGFNLIGDNLTFVMSREARASALTS
ncbi:ABC transporter permease [Candidatus Bathyarchaeota archaeon]|nr:ABC transporter permease [Candidatus Bathyarchaeota archaeon]